MRKAGIEDYEVFGRELLSSITDRPVSLEVFADDCEEMVIQAKKIASWGGNVNIKIPICNTKGESTESVIKELADNGVVVNVTAIMTVNQVAMVAKCLKKDVPAIVSVFAGRVADTGLDPVPHMIACAEVLNNLPKAELLWASPREVLNIFQADASGCQIITVASDLLRKLDLIGKNLDDYSLETVKMFRKDAVAADYKII
tara:strand:- start:452 stop:1054 length:603 start_codon:yes stop_codon:yes gene_type:complete